jgi:uncharacterized protein
LAKKVIVDIANDIYQTERIIMLTGSNTEKEDVIPIQYGGQILSQRIQDDIFIIPIQNEKYIFYFPLRKGIMYGDNKAKTIIEKFITDDSLTVAEKTTKTFKMLEQLKAAPVISSDFDKIDDFVFNNITVLLTNKCNLNCSYCFSKKSRNNESLDFDKIKMFFDFYITKLRDSKKKEFIVSFLGGGEPTIEWENLVNTVNYIKSICHECLSPIFVLTTNCTLLDDFKLKWIEKNIYRLCVSTDILEEVQNTQRKPKNSAYSHFAVIDENIKRLQNYNIRFIIRATITDVNVNLMKEMIEYSNMHYPHCKYIQLEPVNSKLSYETQKLNYELYIEEFFKARNYGKQNGIEVTCSIMNSMNKNQLHHCNGEICITPENDIVLCHRTSRNDNDFDFFNYGHIGSQIKIDYDKLMSFRKFNALTIPECKKCFAKYQCAGCCLTGKYEGDKYSVYADVCAFVKTFYIEYLKEIVGLRP